MPKRDRVLHSLLLGVMAIAFGCLTRPIFSQEVSPVAKHSTLGIFFLDEGYGWAEGEQNGHSVLFYTEDRGETWSRMSPEVNVSHLFFVNRQVGWGLVVNEVSQDSYHTVLYQTPDGGHTWSKRSTIIGADDAGPNSMVLSYRFVDSEHGWFVGQGNAGAVVAFQTGNGGQSIQVIGSLLREHSLRDIYALSPNRVWVFGDAILASFDGGRTWQRQLDEKRYGFRSGSFQPGGQGWAVGEGGEQKHGSTIFATADFGKTWRLVLNENDGARLSAVSFGDATHGCAVGDSIILYCTSDGGQTWNSRQTLPKRRSTITGAGPEATAGFTRVCFTSATRGWVISEGSYLFQTNDGGATWRERDLMKETEKHALHSH